MKMVPLLLLILILLAVAANATQNNQLKLILPPAVYAECSWNTFLTKYKPAQNDKPGKDKFITVKNDSSELSLEAYRNKYADSKAPDVINVMLGSNAVFGYKEDYLESGIDQLFNQCRRNQHRLVEQMIEHYDTGKYRDVSVIPAHVNIDCENNFPAVSEPAIGRSYAKAVRQSNGLHPVQEGGYQQIDDSFYGWLIKLSDKT